MGGRVGLWLWPVATLAVALALYANALSNPLIGDDELALTQNPTVAQPSAAGLAALWTHDYWRGVDAAGRPTEMSTDRNLYRPITTLSFWLTSRLAGLDAPAFRIGNVVLHALAAWLVGLLCRRWGLGPGGLAATAVVLLHPVATDVVNRIVGRADALALAGVAGFLIAQRGGDLRGWTWGPTLAAALAAAVALGAKESGAVIVPLALVQAWLGHATPARPLRRGRGLAALALPLGLYLIGRSLAVGVPSYAADPLWDLGGNPAWGKSLSVRLPVAAALAWHYAGTLVWPWPLIAFDVPPRLPTWEDPVSWLGAAWLALVGAAFVGLAVRRHVLTLPVAWWLASFLVVGQLLTPIGAYREVRFGYGMLGGLAFAAGWLARRAAAGALPLRVATGATALAAASLMAISVVHRNADFVDLRHLLEADVRQRPASPAALIRLANIHDRARRDAEAERLHRQVCALAPDSAQASYELANFYERRGRGDEARSLYEHAVELSPSHYMALVSLGVMALNGGDLARADALLARAAAIAPDDPFVIYNRAVVDDHRGNRARARASLEALVARRPDFALAVRGLERMRAAQGY